MCRTLTKYSQNVTMPRQSRYKCTIKLHHIPNMIHKTPPVNLVLSLENGAHVTQCHNMHRILGCGFVEALFKDNAAVRDSLVGRGEGWCHEREGGGR